MRSASSVLTSSGCGTDCPFANPFTFGTMGVDVDAVGLEGPATAFEVTVEAGPDG